MLRVSQRFAINKNRFARVVPRQSFIARFYVSDNPVTLIPHTRLVLNGKSTHEIRNDTKHVKYVPARAEQCQAVPGRPANWRGVTLWRHVRRTIIMTVNIFKKYGRGVFASLSHTLINSYYISIVLFYGLSYISGSGYERRVVSFILYIRICSSSSYDIKMISK